MKLSPRSMAIVLGLSADQEYFGLAPISRNYPYWRKGAESDPQNLLPFEEELVQIIRTFQTTNDASEKVELMKQYNEMFTENIYHIGLTVAPGALIVNKRLRNIPEGKSYYFVFLKAASNLL